MGWNAGRKKNLWMAVLLVPYVTISGSLVFLVLYENEPRIHKAPIIEKRASENAGTKPNDNSSLVPTVSSKAAAESPPAVAGQEVAKKTDDLIKNMNVDFCRLLGKMDSGRHQSNKIDAGTVLDIGGFGCFFGESIGAIDRYWVFVDADDKEGYQTLEQQGLVTHLEDDHIRIIRSKSGYYEVRVIGGPKDGKLGWIAASEAERMRADNARK